MDLQIKKYSDFALCREMMEAALVLKNYRAPSAPEYRKGQKILLTGEGSSRIFPAKQAQYINRRSKSPLWLETEGCTQAAEYPLLQSLVIGASNSGETRELISLFRHLQKQGHKDLYGLSSSENSTLQKVSRNCHVLGCGREEAVAATKSVVEQALYLQYVLAGYRGETPEGQEETGAMMEEVLQSPLDPEIHRALESAETLYFAGRNNGIAEELALKTNEIARKRACYLEGTYLLHGIEEVLSPKDSIVLIDPFPEEEEAIEKCLRKGAGVHITAIASRPTRFPTLIIPDSRDFSGYLQLAAGWNMLVECGMALGIDLDKPLRARKVGNQWVE